MEQGPMYTFSKGRGHAILPVSVPQQEHYFMSPASIKRLKRVKVKRQCDISEKYNQQKIEIAKEIKNYDVAIQKLKEKEDKTKNN